MVRSAFATTEVWVHPNGKVAYLGTTLGGDRVYTIDISDPANPGSSTRSRRTRGSINDIMTDAGGQGHGVHPRGRVRPEERHRDRRPCDDPLHPKVVAEFTEGVTAGVHSAFIYTQPKYGTHVYLTNDGTGAIHVIDINDPAHPKQVGTVEDAEARTRAGCCTTSTCRTGCSTPATGTTGW